MKLDSSVVLNAIKNNGGLFKNYGELEQSSLLKKMKSALMVSTLVLSVSASASILPNHQENNTGKAIKSTETIIKKENINNTLINNYIVISNLKNGNYENIDFSDIKLEGKELNEIKKDKRNISSILTEVQSKNKKNMQSEINVPALGIKISLSDDENTLKEKLTDSAQNIKNNDDVRVRAQTMVFIIANEGLSSNKGKDAQNHLTVGYGYDVNEQINARVNAGMTTIQAKKEVYSELAAVGLNIKQLTSSYNNGNHNIEISPAQGAILSANILDDYISYAKKSAGPNLWGLYKDGDIKPADLNRSDWSRNDFEKKGGYYNNYMILNNRMKSAYVYSVYNAGPKGLGNQFKKQLEKGNIYSAVHSINVTWRDKDNQVIQNKRLMNNLALAFSSSYTMNTFVSNESDKYIQKEISQALSDESPDIAKMLKLQEAYNKNVIQLFSLDVKKIKNGELSQVETNKYNAIKKQSDGILININKYRVSFGDKEIEAYSPSKNITNFEKQKLVNDDVLQFEEEFNNFNDAVLKSYSNQEISKELSKEDKLKIKEEIKSNIKDDNFRNKLLNIDIHEFKPKVEQISPSYLEKIKSLVVQEQEREIQELRLQAFKKKMSDQKTKKI